MTWFERLTGFREGSWHETRAQLSVDGERLVSRANGASWGIGTLDTPSLAELRAAARAVAPAQGARLRVGNRIADARALHAQPECAGALVQVASQFNLLEMPGPEVTPEDGVTGYEHDRTQGPACAMAAAPATLYRNYFADTGQGLGQTRERQVNTLRDLADDLAPGAIAMKNGYAFAQRPALQDIAARLRAADAAERDRLRSRLRIGVHSNVEVTESGPGCGQRVSQAFCSALPVAYSGVAAAHWEPFARLVLEASYEATLWAGVLNAARGGSHRVFLTMLGGGVFGNDPAWIVDAMRRALGEVRAHGLVVELVSYRSVPAELRQLALEF